MKPWQQTQKRKPEQQQTRDRKLGGGEGKLVIGKTFEKKDSWRYIYMI